MRGRLAGLALAWAAALQAQYQYNYPGPRYYNGSYQTTYTNNPYTVYQTFYNGAAIAPPEPNDYEVKTTLGLNAPGGTYIHFLRADAAAVQPGVGNYLSVEIVVPPANSWSLTQFSGATLNVNQCVNGNVSQLASTAITVFNGMTLRTAIFGTNLWVFDSTGTLIVTQTVPLFRQQRAIIYLPKSA